MRLQGEAEDAGGRVHVLLGNHDVLILSAQRFGGNFVTSWRRNGGIDADLHRLRQEHIEWVASLPAMLRIGGTLYAHADALFYERYGRTIGEVNRAFQELLRGADRQVWDRLLDDFSQRHAFDGHGGAVLAARFLSRYGGRRFVHGHTPIQKVTGQSPEQVTRSYTYAGGLCTNVDGGLYLGGPGFVYEVRD